MNAHEHYQAGHLSEAISAATEAVRNRPGDVAARSFLCELFCFAGDLERADKQLDAIGDLESDAALGVSLFRHLIRAETWRQQFWNEGRVPEFVEQPSVELEKRLQATVSLREGDTAGALAALKEAESLRTPPTLVCDGAEVAEFRDLDDVLGPVLEVLTSNGKYYWVPINRVISMEFQPIRHARDTLWRPTHIDVREGPEGEVYLPALYPGSHTSEDEKNRLGRATDWQEIGAGVMRGVGQKMYLVGDDARPFLQIGEVTLTSPASAGEEFPPDEGGADE